MYAFSTPFHKLLLVLVEHKISTSKYRPQLWQEYEALVTLLDSKKQDVYLFKTPVPCFLEYIHNPLIIVCSVDDLNALVLYLERINLFIYILDAMWDYSIRWDFKKWMHWLLSIWTLHYI